MTEIARAFFSTAESPADWALNKAVGLSQAKRPCRATLMTEASVILSVPSALKNLMCVIVKIPLAIFATTVGQIPPVKAKVWKKLENLYLVSHNLKRTFVDIAIHVYKTVMFLTFSPFCLLFVGNFSIEACKHIFNFMQGKIKQNKEHVIDNQEPKNQEDANAKYPIANEVKKPSEVIKVELEEKPLPPKEPVKLAIKPNLLPPKNLAKKTLDDKPIIIQEEVKERKRLSVEIKAQEKKQIVDKVAEEERNSILLEEKKHELLLQSSQVEPQVEEVKDNAELNEEEVPPPPPEPSLPSQDLSTYNVPVQAPGSFLDEIKNKKLKNIGIEKKEPQNQPDFKSFLKDNPLLQKFSDYGAQSRPGSVNAKSRPGSVGEWGDTPEPAYQAPVVVEPVKPAKVETPAPAPKPQKVYVAPKLNNDQKELQELQRRESELDLQIKTSLRMKRTQQTMTPDEAEKFKASLRAKKKEHQKLKEKINNLEYLQNLFVPPEDTKKENSQPAVEKIETQAIAPPVVNKEEPTLVAVKVEENNPPTTTNNEDQKPPVKKAPVKKAPQPPVIKKGSRIDLNLLTKMGFKPEENA